MLHYCIVRLKKFVLIIMSNTEEILEPSNEQMKVEQLHSSLLVRNLKIFEEAGNAGSEISYRCNKC